MKGERNSSVVGGISSASNLQTTSLTAPERYKTCDFSHSKRSSRLSRVAWP